MCVHVFSCVRLALARARSLNWQRVRMRRAWLGRVRVHVRVRGRECARLPCHRRSVCGHLHVARRHLRPRRAARRARPVTRASAARVWARARARVVVVGSGVGSGVVCRHCCRRRRVHDRARLGEIKSKVMKFDSWVTPPHRYPELPTKAERTSRETTKQCARRNLTTSDSSVMREHE